MGDDYDDYNSGSSNNLDDIDSTLHEILSAIQSKGSGSDLAGVAWVLFAMLLISGWSGSKLDRFTDRLWYSVAHDTDWKNVNVEMT